MEIARVFRQEALNEVEELDALGDARVDGDLSNDAALVDHDDRGQRVYGVGMHRSTLAIEGEGSEDKRRFMEIARKEGLRKAIAWRDARFAGSADG